MQLVDRRTGKLVDIPDTDVTQAFKSGMYGLPKGAVLPVAQPGLIGTVDAASASQALSQGMTVPTEQRFREAQRDVRYGGVGGTVAAAGVGAIRGIGDTFSLPTDELAVEAARQGVFGAGEDVNDPYRGRRHVSAEEGVRERLQAYQELHPYASMAGEMAGIAGGAALGGGILGRVGALGELAGGGSRLAAGALRGAAEGAYLGGIGAINESALGDSELNGEKLVAGMGHGAFMGGALGAGFSGLGLLKDEIRDATGRYASQLRAADVDALAEKTFGYAPEGLGQRVQKAYAKLSAGVSGKDPEVINRLTELSAEGSEARRIAVYDAPKIQEEAQRAIRENVDNILRSGDLVSAEARGTLKADYVRKAVATGNEEAVRESVGSQLQRLIDGAEGQLTAADGIAPQMIKSVETVSRAAYRAQSALEAGADNAALFVEMDNVKRAVQKLTNTGYKSIRNISDPLEQLSARGTVDWLRGAASDLRAGLEDESLWGKAAADQRVINAAWTKQIDASQRFHRALTTETVRDPNNPYQRLMGADPGKVESYVRNLVNPNNDLTHTAVRDFVDGSRELADAIRKSYDLPPDKLAEVARVRAASEAFGQTLGKAEQSLVLANQFRALTEGTTDSLSAILGTVGGVVGGLPGGAFGAAAGAVANPGRVVAQLAAVERLMMKVDSRIGSSVRSFLRGEKAAGPAALPEAATSKGFDRMTKVVAESVGPDGALTPAGTARIADALGSLPETAPKLSVSASGVATRIAQFLSSKVPVGMRDPNDMFPGDEPPLVSDSERETWARYVKAAQDPTSVLEHLARGDVTPEEAETLKVCYPRLYASVQQQIVQKVTEAQSAGKPLPYDKRVALGTLFEARTDATMGPDVMVAVANARHRRGGSRHGAQQQGPSSIRPIRGLGTNLQTTFQAAGSRRKGGLL